MQVPWIDSVKSAGYLTVYNGIDQGKWSGVFKYLLHNFTTLTNKKIDLKAEKDINAANVVMQISDGVGSYTYEGTTGKAVFSATAAHGKTLPFQRDGRMEKAAVFLPKAPTYDHKNHLYSRPSGQHSLPPVAPYNGSRCTGHHGQNDAPARPDHHDDAPRSPFPAHRSQDQNACYRQPANQQYGENTNP